MRACLPRAPLRRRVRHAGTISLGLWVCFEQTILLNNADFSRNHPFSPRLWGAAARFALAPPSALLPAPPPRTPCDGFGQAEWAQRYDSDASLSVAGPPRRCCRRARSPRPKQAIENISAIVANGGWNKVPTGATLKLGSSGPAVHALRKRSTSPAISIPRPRQFGIYDSYVEAGVKRSRRATA